MNEMLLPGALRDRSGRDVLDALRDDILSLRLVPGTVLSRAELQERFRISSTPVRDALIRLREEGLVDIFPQHATLVSRIDVARASQARFLRRSIELELVYERASTPDAGVVARLRGLMRRQTALAAVGEHEAFAEADQAFHRTLYEAAGVLDLWHLVRRQGGHIDRLRRLNLPVAGKLHQILSDHTAVTDAIEAGRPEVAQAALREHLSHSMEFVDHLRQSHPAYFT